MLTAAGLTWFNLSANYLFFQTQTNVWETPNEEVFAITS
jgi:hypothetical protein